MSKRKIVLLALIVVLVGIYIGQSIVAGKTTVHDVTLKEEMDSIRITQTDGISYILTRKAIPATPTEGETASDGETQEIWLFQNGETAENFAVSQMESQLQTIRVLDTVSESGDAGRYDLDGTSVLTAEALKEGKVVRSIRIGKASETTSQTYVQLDDSSEIVLVAGSLANIFGKTADELVVIEEVVEPLENEELEEINTVSE